MKTSGAAWLGLAVALTVFVQADDTNQRNDKKELLDDLLEQAKAARENKPESEHNRASQRDLSSAGDPDASSSNILDHLLNKAMEEKVSRESDASLPEAQFREEGGINRGDIPDAEQEDLKQKSRFKYLFFEILTPDEYNDIIYLGEDLLDPIEEKLKEDDDDANKHRYMSDKFDPNQLKSSPHAEKMERYSQGPSEDHYAGNSEQRKYNERESHPQEHMKVDERKAKMESLLQRMSERYKSRSMKKDDVQTDSKENEKTRKLKNMIEILREKIVKYESEDDKRRTNTEADSIRRSDNYAEDNRRSDMGYESKTSKPSYRSIQRTRTTPSPDHRQSIVRTLPTKQTKKSNQEKLNKWQSAMDELSSKISKMSSGIHRIDLDEMLDLDMLEVPEEDQKSSDSYPRTTAIPSSRYSNNLGNENYDSKLKEKNYPKRQVTIHPKLTYQRPVFDDIHRPSMNIKDMIKDRESSYNPPHSSIKSLPPIARYQEREPLYKPTTSFVNPEECPYIPKRANSECYNAPPSECHAIGYADPTCPQGSLCCFDGCINLCWRNPHSPPKLPPLAPPPSQYGPPRLPASPPPKKQYTPKPKKYGYTTTKPTPPPHSPTPHPSKEPHSFLPKEPIFYQPAPKDFEPKVGPDPVIHGRIPHPSEVESDYHIETKPLLPPSLPRYSPIHKDTPAAHYLPPQIPSYAPPDKQYILADTYRTTAKPSYSPPAKSTTKPAYGYQPPTKGYLPPLENADALHDAEYSHHRAKSLDHQARDKSTAYPPPSSYYREPSIKFIAKGVSRELPHIPPQYSTMSPPSKDYLPPKEGKSLDFHSHMQTYQAPNKEYLPPPHHKSTRVPDHMVSYQPPQKNYLPPINHSTPPPVHMTSYRPPEKEYLPPHTASTIRPPSYKEVMTHKTPVPAGSYQPPRKGYIPPANLLVDTIHKGTPQPVHPAYHMSSTYEPPTRDYVTPVPHMSTSYAPPSKDYLPPQHLPTQHPHHEMSTTYSPPSKDYLPPEHRAVSQHHQINSGYQPPSKGYLPPPENNHHHEMSTSYRPPSKDYLPPYEGNGGKNHHEMSTSYRPPSKDYLPPHEQNGDKNHHEMSTSYRPPSKDYLPPNPHSESPHEMSTSYRPPSKSYHPPEKHDSYHEMSASYRPPSKDYLPPKETSYVSTTYAPPSKTYLPPDHGHEVNHMSTSYKPPSKEYLPPVSPTPLHHHVSSSYAPPSKGYLPPKKEKGPADYMTHMNPPTQEYGLPDHMSHMVPPSSDYKEPQFAVCPHFTLKERSECPYIKHQCWSPGVPDADCPHHGLCCFDGCNNVCLDPAVHKAGGYHVPSHSAHIVPGHKYVPSPGHEEHPEKFHHRTLKTPDNSYLAPMHETEKVYHLVNSDGAVDYVQKLPSSYLPPAKDYLPPPEKAAPSIPLDYIPPSKSYLPPPIDQHIQKELKDYQTPKTSYKPPDHNYLPPKESHPNAHKESNAYEPPQYEYLPPKKEEQHPYASYLPPSKDYIPPTHHEEHGYMEPPSKEYLPPVHSEHEDPPSSYMTTSGLIPHAINIQINIPPADDRKYKESDTYREQKHIEVHHRPEYVSAFDSNDELYSPPPKLPSYNPTVTPALPHYDHKEPPLLPAYDQSVSPLIPKYQPASDFRPPHEEYLPPPPYLLPEHGPHQEGTQPHLLPHHPLPQGYDPPSKEYLPPKPGYNAPSHTYEVPHSEYLPPKPSYPTQKPHYLPSKSTYEPPHFENNLMREYQPPHAEYLPPKPHYSSPKPSYEPPHKEYLPPKLPSYNDHGLPQEYLPPTSDYLPPHNYLPPKPGYEAPHNPEYSEYQPPSKEYLPPHPTFNPHHIDNHSPRPGYEPPSEYLPPHAEYKPPHGDYLPPKPSYKPPHKEYLPPPPEHDHHDLPTSYKPPHSDYLAPSDHKKGYDYKPPGSSDYLPPPPEHEQYKPPHRDYLPPPPHHDHHGLPTSYKPPHSDYLPPSDHNKGYDYKPPGSSDYLPPPPEHEQYKPPNKDYLPPPPDHDHHGLPTSYKPPHSDYLPPSDHNKGYDYKPPHHEQYKPPHKEYIPPPPDHHSLPSSYKPPQSDYLPPSNHNKGYDYKPPNSRDYLPPPPRDYQEGPSPSQEYLPPPPPELIPDIDDEFSNLLSPPDREYLPPPPRGPQFQLEGGHDKSYVPPPPRSSDTLTVPEILNSHIEPPRGDVDHYIPPKTKHDVPKNFIRPEDLPPPPPEYFDYDIGDYDIGDYGDGDSDIQISLEDLESLGLPGLESLGLNDINGLSFPGLNEIDGVPPPFLGFAKFTDGRNNGKGNQNSNRGNQNSNRGNHKKNKDNRGNENEQDSINGLDKDQFEKLRLRPGDAPFPPMPTHAPNSKDFVPIIEKLRPEVLAQLRKAQTGGGGGGGTPGFIPGKAGMDYPDFKSIPATDFTCENFILPGFYADTFTSCQVFHVCEEGKRQSSFLCPRGTIFNQKYRVCDWWYNVKCEDSTEFFDLNLDLLLLEDQKKSGSVIPSNNLGLDLGPLIEEQGLGQLGPLASKMKKSERRGSGSGSSVTLCQLMNICDTIPMGSNRIEEKSQSPHSDLPFASSLRSELVVEAPDSMTSDSNIDPVMIDLTEVKEKKPRMEDVNFQDGRPSHREIDFSQGIPVRTKEDKSRSRAQPLMTDNLMSGMDDSMPISSIDFDFKPNAPTARNAGQADTAFAAGNLYENMAKQLEAFLEGQETRHPKMVDALISNTTHVVIGGNEMNNLNIEEHVFNISNDLEDISTTAATSMVAEAYNDKHDNTNEITDNAFPAFDMENHVKGEKDIRADKAPNKTFIESGWTPLVIGSLPGISAKSNTSFMSRMLDMTTRNHTRDLRDLWRPSGPVLMSRRD